ncbi:MAG: helix-turn-helix domain-containing protein [Planctomycetes bacterium]|nr:helix-turn-helix domain-containing protein [Planctomycetota bacterium]
MLLTVKQVAARLQVTDSCIHWLLNAGHMKHIRLGFGRGTIRIADDEVRGFIQRNTVPRRSRVVPQPRPKAPSTFTHLNSQRMRQRWAEQGVGQPVRQQAACAASGRRDASRLS